MLPSSSETTPPLDTHTDDVVRRLRAWLDRSERVFVLTGAGISTASGIPDYRDANGAWKRRPPVTWQAFVGDAATYRRYWARSYVGWPIFSSAEPNATHHALVGLERSGRMSGLITQNVDGLHQRAGSREVIDLHGRLDGVVCLGCGDTQPRDELQHRLAATNPDWQPRSAAAAPDGDADIDARSVADFEPPLCAQCGGLLKPDVVFFGENVPRARYARAIETLQNADAVLVVGSSLMVYSGFRFVRVAHERGVPIAILNRGATRADALAGLKLEADCGEVLAAVIGQAIVQRAT